MTAANDNSSTWRVIPVNSKTDGGKNLTVESFLTAKLGLSTGKRLYKELVAAAKEATKSITGSPAIDLTGKGGAFISAQELK